MADRLRQRSKQKPDDALLPLYGDQSGEPSTRRRRRRKTFAGSGGGTDKMYLDRLVAMIGCFLFVTALVTWWWNSPSSSSSPSLQSLKHHHRHHSDKLEKGNHHTNNINLHHTLDIAKQREHHRQNLHHRHEVEEGIHPPGREKRPSHLLKKQKFQKEINGHPKISTKTKTEREQEQRRRRQRQHQQEEPQVTTPFTCANGDGIGLLNDNYCDCSDGSDEPNTSACSRILVQKRVFACQDNANTFVFTSRVGDGVKDCPNGRDEE